MAASIIHLEEIKKSYFMGKHELPVLKGLSLDIFKNEYVALMGPSGSGKSTLMNIIGCLDTPTAGKYVLNNNDVSQMADDALAEVRNKEIGFVFQSFHLLARNSALSNVMLPLRYAGFKEDEAEIRAKDVLDQVGLIDRMDHSPSELSGGQQQRVAIARALVSDPDILVCDEPTGDLDRNTASEILDLLQILNRDHGKTILMVTHDPVAAEFAKRTLHLDKGKLTD